MMFLAAGKSRIADISAAVPKYQHQLLIAFKIANG
jgi:hypothetical protein